MLGIRPLLLIAITLAVAADYPHKLCNKNSDCGEDACCVQAPGMIQHCRPIGKEGDYCITKEFFEFKNDKYFLRCPCAEGLECVFDDPEFPGSKKTIFNVQCRKKKTEEN